MAERRRWRIKASGSFMLLFCQVFKWLVNAVSLTTAAVSRVF
jgi:hypothetical protein